MQNLVPIINNKNNKDDINDRIIDVPKYISGIQDKSLKLQDTLILYNDGSHWKAIPLNIMLMYPVIHDKCDNQPITIFLCPYTLFSCVYFDKFVPGSQVYNNNLTLVNKNYIMLPIIGNIYDKDMKIKDVYIRKSEVKIMSLRNAISNFPDCQFIDTSVIEKISPLTNNEYFKNKIINFPINKYSNKHQPKQIIYVIEYKSKKQEDYKYTVIVPKKNIFDISKNKFEIYFNKMIDKIRDKGGHIYTCVWFAFDSTHTNFKVINI